MYIFDTNVFGSLGVFYPSRFPTIWDRLEALVQNGELRSVREVRREIESNCPYVHVAKWVHDHRHIFVMPDDEETQIVAQIFLKEQYRGLVKRTNILRGMPVADPFIVAAAKVHNGYVVTQESLKSGGARIPTVCQELNVPCTDFEGFLELEDLKY